MHADTYQYLMLSCDVKFTKIQHELRIHVYLYVLFARAISSRFIMVFLYSIHSNLLFTLWALKLELECSYPRNTHTHYRILFRCFFFRLSLQSRFYLKLVRQKKSASHLMRNLKNMIFTFCKCFFFSFVWFFLYFNFKNNFFVVVHNFKRPPSICTKLTLRLGPTINSFNHSH